jgi:hypothetical protein
MAMSFMGGILPVGLGGMREVRGVPRCAGSMG